MVRYDFPLRNFFSWALVLPLAFPPYVGAYTYSNLLSYTGPVQLFLRSLGIQVNQEYFDIMNIKGAIFIYTVFLFPYVYLIARSFIQKESGSLIEVSRTLGKNAWEIFFKVVLPISRGPIIAGVSLVLMEVLNDYGVVKYFGIQTLSTTIFTAWFNMGDLTAAKKVASTLMVFVFVLLFIERFSRRRKRYEYTTTKVKPLNREKLGGLKGVLVSLFAFAIFSIGFLIPLIQIIYSASFSLNLLLNSELIVFVLNSLKIAITATIVIVVFSLIIANTVRIATNGFIKSYRELATFGYSVPGAVVAIGILYVIFSLNNVLFNGNAGFLLSSTTVILLFAYLIRFLAVGYSSIEAGFQKIGKSFFEASRTLGHGVTATFFKVDLPMLRPAVVSAILLVMLEIFKELPLTLILRPFNFETLATKIYQYTSDEMLPEASVLSLILVLICTAGVYLVTHLNTKEVK
ncbi:iron(III) transport system permease protein [Fervidobacterium gondwanense DSM 13020]|uniref:Iron(III) transport system permease protein n=1 Tax=Fervidobacterium gondwanense DSM 13020 TaxID=1121883 RepID=A0A1M7SKK1_FERGO|nr:iron(III) transport system permease protein [Fervidobacterium gondwanense DSM 13020]